MASNRANEGEGFKIRGAASQHGSRREERPPPPRRSRTPSPPRGQHSYHDLDAPGRGDDRRRTSDRYQSDRYDARYYDRYSDYDDRRYRSSRYSPPPRDYYQQRDYYDARPYERPYDTRDYDDEPEQEPAPTGDADVATNDQQWQVLLIRGLKLAVDENLLAKGLEKLYLDDSEETGSNTQEPPPGAMPLPPGMPPSTAMPLPPGMPARPSQPKPLGATPQTLKRVFVIRDRVTGKSLGYGFAEYHSLTDARAALAKAKNLGNSCTIASKQIDVGYPHLGVFKPVLGQSREDAQYAFEFKGQQFQYFDTNYYASPAVINEKAPAQAKRSSPAKEAPVKTGKKRTKTQATSDDPQNNKKVKHSESKKAEQSGPMLSQMDIWAKKQAELQGETKGGEKDDVTASPPASSEDQGRYEPISFVWRGIKNSREMTCCLLCNTELKGDVTPESHVCSSEKHKHNLQDDAKYQEGLDRIKKWNLSPNDMWKIRFVPESAQGEDQEEQKEQEQEAQKTKIALQNMQALQPVYIDRAKERREREAKAEAGNGFKKISLKGAGQKPKEEPNKKSNERSPVQEVPSFGFGRSMLEKAGWKEGQGLGSGNGRTELIEQNNYAAGVGLGHESSNQGDAIEHAQRMTRNDGGDFVKKTMDKARERFQKMG